MFKVYRFAVIKPPPPPPPQPIEYGHDLLFNHTKSKVQDEAEISPNLMLSMIFPDKFNLTLNEAFSQENLGACVPNAFAAAVQILTGSVPSRLYLYYNARLALGVCPNNDSGLDLGRALPIMTSYGRPVETLFPYNIKNFKNLPPYSCYRDDPISPETIIYSKIAQTEESIKTNLQSGNPIIFGIHVFRSFLLKNVETTGIIPYPNRRTERYLGGHCILMIGWTTYNNQEYFIIRNSWGTIWGNTGETTLNIVNGNNGYGYIPKTYILDLILAFDFYAIKIQ
jgi:hypothetical protein